MMNAGNLKGKTRQTSDWRRRMIAFVSALTLLISSCGLTAFAEPDEDIYSDPVTAPIPAANTSPEPEEGEAEATPAPEDQPETGTEPQEATGEETETGGEPEVSEEPEDLTVYEPGALTAEADGIGITVDYTAEARVPEGAVLTLTRAAGGDLYSALKSASKVLKTEENATWKRELGEDAVFYAISLTNPEGNEVHPETGVTLTCTNLEIPADATGFVTGDNAENLDWKDTLTVGFLPDAIGYAYLKQVQIGTVTLTHEDRDYMVTAAYGPDAGFPADTELKVREILPGTPEYALYSGMTDEALNEDWAEITLERYFDIAFIANGEEMEPKADVDVQIVFRDKIEQNEETEVAAVHIENNEANVIEADTDSTKSARHDDEAIDTVTFTSDSFSVYGVVQKKKIITKVLAADGNTYEIEISYTQEAEIPEESQVKVEEIPEGSDLWEAYRKQTAAALNADDVRLPGLYDISIVDGEGNKVEPKAPVNVAFKLIREDNLTQDLQVVHFTEEIPQEQVAAESKADESSTDEIKDQPKVQTEEQTETQAAEQTEVQPKVQPEEQTEPQTTEQTEVQPKVQTEEHTEPQAAEQTEVQAPNKPEPLAEEDKIASETISASVEGDTVIFDTQSFSVYAFAYTVDFHYVIDGQRYDFSIPGGGYVSISEIMELLHIPTARGSARDVEEWPEEAHGEAAKVYFIPNVKISEETRNFVAQIENIQFSSPNLVSVSKVESTSTVGQIKERLGLACEYSAELTEKNIEDINSQTIQAGDWVLISVLPFTSEEWLTVTMKDGEVFTIKVTDAQIKTTVKSASGDLYEIIVTYNDTAEIPDDAELLVREIMSNEESYQNNVERANQELLTQEKATVDNPVQFDISIISVDGEIIEPREGSLVSVEIKMVPEIFETRSTEGENNDQTSNPQIWLYGGDVDIEGDGSEKQFTVVHMVNDEDVEVVENVVSSVGEDDRIVLQFETESFSAFMVAYDTDWSQFPSTLYVGDEIYLYNCADVWATGIGPIIDEIKHDNDAVLKVVVAKNPGEFYFCNKNDWNNGNPYNYLKKITIEAAPGGTHPGTIGTVENSKFGIDLNIFKYDLTGKLDDRFNNNDYPNNTYTYFENVGINDGHTLKFWGSGVTSGNYNTKYNGYTASSVSSEMVKIGLSNGRTGYPVLYDGSNLEYLFSPSGGTDKEAYTGADRLFKKDGDYYIYNSNTNYAWLNTTTKKFEVYGSTYYQKSGSEYGSDASFSEGSYAGQRKPIGFFPFHEYTSSYDQYVNWNKSLKHHFGLSMSVDFTLPKDPKAVTDSQGNPIVFEFSGDDDMWVFVDGKLIMDIGGIHQPINGTINFRDRIVTVNGSTQMNTQTFNDRFPDLFNGDKHTLQVFYLERGGCDSNCMIKFNLTQYGKLDLLKKGENGQELEGAIFGLYKDPECTQLLTEVLKNGVSQEFIAVSGKDGRAVFEGIPLGTYYLKEIQAPNGFELEKPLTVNVFTDSENGPVHVVVTVDNQVVDNAHPANIVNKKKSITVEKEWYLKPANGGTPILMQGGNPVSMQLYRSKYPLSTNGSGTDVTITTNGSSKPITLTGDINSCKTGDTIKITVTSGKHCQIKMDYIDANGYHGDGAFGIFDVSPNSSKSVIKTIGSGFTEVNFGTWNDNVKAGDCTIDIKVIRRSVTSSVPTGKDPVDAPFVLSSQNGWTKTFTGLDGTDPTDGAEYYYFFEEQGAAADTQYIERTETDGTTVWTVKNYTDELGQTVKLRKRAIVSKVPIAGAGFQIFTENPDQNPNAEPIAITEQLISDWMIKTNEMSWSDDGKTLISDSSGRFYSGFLPVGEYYIKETIPPENYIVDNTVHAIRITSTGMDILTNGVWVPRQQSGSGDYYELYIDNIPTTSITVEKVWADHADQQVTLKLISYKKGAAGQTEQPSDGNASVILYIHDTNQREKTSNTGYTLSVPKGSYVNLSYSTFRMSSNWTADPYCELYYWDEGEPNNVNDDLWVSDGTLNEQGPLNNKQVYIGNKDEYCILIKITQTNKQYGTYSLTSSNSSSDTTGTGTLHAPSGYILDDDFAAIPVSLPDGTAWWKRIDNLPVYDQDGNVYYYGIVEENVPSGYDVTYSSNNPVSADATGNIELRATNTPKKGSLKIQKNTLLNGKPANATKSFNFGVYRTDNPTGDPVATGTINLNNASTGTTIINNLNYGTYYVFELDDNNKPILDGNGTIGEVVYEVTSTGPEVTVNGTTGGTDADVTVTNNDTRTDKVYVVKRWYNAYGQYDQSVAKKVKVKLHQIDSDWSSDVTEISPNESVEFTIPDLDASYYVEETDTFTGFTTTYIAAELDSSISEKAKTVPREVSVHAGETLYIMNTATLTGMQVVMHKKWVEFKDPGGQFYLGQLDGYTTNTSAERKYMKLKVELLYDVYPTEGGEALATNLKATNDEIIVWEPKTSGHAFPTTYLNNNIILTEGAPKLVLNYIGDWEWGFRENTGSGQDGGPGKLPEYGFYQGQLVHYIYHFNEIRIYDGADNGGYNWDNPRDVTDEWWKLLQNPEIETGKTRTNWENRPKRLPVIKKWYKDSAVQFTDDEIADLEDLQNLNSITVKLYISFDNGSTWEEGDSLVLLKTENWSSCFEDLETITRDLARKLENITEAQITNAMYKVEEIWDEEYARARMDYVNHQGILKNKVMPKGSIKIQKNWPNGEFDADAVLLKLHRASNNAIDADTVIADVYEHPENHGIEGKIFTDQDENKYIKIEKDRESNTWPEIEVTNLLIKHSVKADDGTDEQFFDCYYFIEEVGYLVGDTKYPIPTGQGKAWTVAYSGGNNYAQKIVIPAKKTDPDTLVVSNTVPTTSISVTKEWYKADGTVKTPENDETIKFRVYYKVEGDDTAYPYTIGADVSDETYSITYSSTTKSWSPVTLSNLPYYIRISTDDSDQVKAVAGYYVEELTDGMNVEVRYQDGEGARSEVSPEILTGTIKIINTDSTGEVQVQKVFLGLPLNESGEPVYPDGFKITATWELDGQPESRELFINGNQSYDDVTLAASGDGTEGNPFTYVWTISGLPIGTEVTFAEDGNNNINGYIWVGKVSENGEAMTNGTSGKATVSGEQPLPDPAIVKFENSYTPGVELPSTGGPGTMIYTIAGMLLITLAGVLLVSRKRKNEQ